MELKMDAYNEKYIKAYYSPNGHSMYINMA